MTRFRAVAKCAAAATLGLALGGCMLSMPYQIVDETAATAEGDAIVALTYARLRPESDRRGRFYDLSADVIDELEDQPGLIGYRLQRSLSGAEVWTQTVWTDVGALTAFLYTGAHATAASQEDDLVIDSAFANVTIPRSAAPLDWEAAERALAAEKGPRGPQSAAR